MTISLLIRCNVNNHCEIDFTIENKLQGPVNVYLQLDNFYQSHKKFANSLPRKQLRGEAQR